MKTLKQILQELILIRKELQAIRGKESYGEDIIAGIQQGVNAAFVDNSEELAKIVADGREKLIKKGVVKPDFS